MNDNEAIDKAVEGVLSNEEWQALTKDPEVLKELELQLGMDALLRVALEKTGTPEALTEAIEASVGASPVEDLMFSIEAATTGTRKQRRWFTSLPRWTTAAAAVLIGFISGSFAWPDVFLWLDLGPTVAQRTSQRVILLGHIIAEPPKPTPAIPHSFPPPQRPRLSQWRRWWQCQLRHRWWWCPSQNPKRSPPPRWQNPTSSRRPCRRQCISPPNRKAT